MGLTKIPRYFSSCSAWVSSRTETQVTVSWKTAETCNGVSAVYDGSEHWLGDPNSTSGSITLTMNPDTSKNIYFRLRRKDSNLVSNTNQVSASTYAYPYVQSGTDFVIGDALRLNVYNPLNHSYTLNVYASNGSVIGGYNGSGTVLNGFNDTNSIDLMYRNCANRSDTYHVTIDYNGHISTYDKGNTYSADKATPVVGNVVISDTKTFAGIHKQATELIQGRSAIRSTVASVSAQKYARLRKITVSYDGTEKSKSWNDETESDSNIVFDFTTSNSSELTVTVEDSRGLKSTRKIQLSFLQFAMPSLTLTAERGIYDAVYKTWKSDANHGTYAKCVLGGSTDSHLDIDAAKSVIKINNTSTSISSFGDMYLGGGNLLYTSGYHIEATLFDALGQSATAVADIASGSRIMTILKDEGIAFGGMAEKGKFKVVGLKMETPYDEILKDLNDTGWNDLYRSSDGDSYVKVRERYGVVYVMGSSYGGGIVLNEKVGTVVATLPNGYLPNGYEQREEIVFAISLKGGSGSASGKIMADGKIELYSTIETVYWGFCISYPL